MKIQDIYNLDEGVKFGGKEISSILSRANDFEVGIEYEFRLSSEEKNNFDELLTEYNINNIDRIEDEHDNMTELVTTRMNITDAFQHLTNMFKLISDHDIEIPKIAGLHISMSTTKYHLNDINMTKFIVLMNTDYIHKLFPERVPYVISLSSIIRQRLEVPKKSFTKKYVSEIEDKIENVIGEKYQTIKVSDYTKVKMAGRIELRFFGGENYHTQLPIIKKELFRALFLLEIAYTNLYQREYYKELYKLVHETNDFEYTIDDINDDPMIIKNIKNPSISMKLAAVRANGHMIKYIENSNDKIKLAAIQENPSSIQYIVEPSDTLQLEAVRKDGTAIRHIKNPSEEIQKEAVKNDAMGIFYVDDITKDIISIFTNENNPSSYYNKLIAAFGYGRSMDEKIADGIKNYDISYVSSLLKNLLHYSGDFHLAESTVSKFIDVYDDNEKLYILNEISGDETLSNDAIIFLNRRWKILYRTSKEPDKVFKMSLDNNIVAILINNIFDDDIKFNDNEKKIIKEYANDPKSAKTISGIVANIGITEKLVDNNVVTRKNIDSVFNNIVSHYGVRHISSDIPKLLEQLNIKSIDVDLSNKNLEGKIEENLNDYIGLIQSVKTVPNTIKEAVLKFILREYILGKNTDMTYEQAWKIVKSSVVERAETLLDGLFYPIDDEFYKIIQKTIKNMISDTKQ